MCDVMCSVVNIHTITYPDRCPWNTIHENTLMDVGRAMSSVAEEKYALVSTSNPEVNM